MGNCFSQHDDQEKEAAHRSAQIDRQIEQDGKKLKRECKILLLGTSTLPLHSPLPYLGGLGSSESGKSTIVKQMRIIHQDGFSYDTKITYREAIYSNLLESAQAVAGAMHKFKVEPTDPSTVVGSSPDLDGLMPFSNSISCSKQWNECWGTISIPSYSPRHAHLPLSSRVNLPKLYSPFGKTRRCQSLLIIMGPSST